jgi:hypothetical protein
MYKIIGADRKEYGPATHDQIRNWIAEHRINAQTQVRAEGDPEWRPLSAFPEFADALGLGSPAPEPFAAGGQAAAPLTAEQLLAQDYSLDIGSCLTRSWGLLKRNFWPMVGISFLVMLVIGALNQVLGLFTGPIIREMVTQRHATPRGVFIVAVVSILSAPVYSVLTAGLFKYYIKLIRGETAGLGDAFSGFGPSTGQLLLLGFLQCLLVNLGLALCIIPGVYLAVSWYFAVPLVIDRRMEFWAAMELSRKVVSRHWFIVFGCTLVMGLVVAAGLLACCVGVLATLPLGMAALMYAYEDLFSRRAG